MRRFASAMVRGAVGAAAFVGRAAMQAAERLIPQGASEVANALHGNGSAYHQYGGQVQAPTVQAPAVQARAITPPRPDLANLPTQHAVQPVQAQARSQTLHQ